jgi:flavin reductase (DIM6/NTAB) family NADH-FMN oxidoreductase RutF
MQKRTFELDGLEARDRYKLLSGLIVPRPIGWVGSRSSLGRDNLAPFSFFNMVTATPPTVLFAPGMSVRSKDTLANVRQHPWFSLNVVTDEVAEAMNLTSGQYPPDIDEFEVAQLTKIEGGVAPVAMVAEARANLECRVVDIHEVGDGPSAAVVFGEVVRLHVDDRILDGTRIDFEQLGVIGRLAGSWYSRTLDLFEMERPD